jgi:hypothetical protein
MKSLDKQLIREIAKNASNPAKNNKPSLIRDLAYKTSSDATTPQNEGKDIASTKASQSDGSPSKLEKCRKDFYWKNTPFKTTIEKYSLNESITVAETRKALSQDSTTPPQQDHWVPNTHGDWRPVDQIPRMVNQQNKQEQMQHQKQMIDYSQQQDYWRPDTHGNWGPANEVPKPAEEVNPQNKQEAHWRPSADGGNWKPA